MRTLKAQMRATRFGLESRMGRQLAHDDPILMWIPTFAGDTIARFRKRSRWQDALGRERESQAESGLEIHWSLMSTSSWKRQGARIRCCQEGEPRLIEAKYLGHDRYHCRRHCLWKTWTSITQTQPRQSEEREVAETQGRTESARPTDEAARRGVQEERAATPASASDAAETEPSAKRTRGGDTRKNNSMLAGRM